MKSVIVIGLLTFMSATSVMAASASIRTIAICTTDTDKIIKVISNYQSFRNSLESVVIDGVTYLDSAKANVTRRGVISIEVQNFRNDQLSLTLSPQDSRYKLGSAGRERPMSCRFITDDPQFNDGI